MTMASHRGRTLELTWAALLAAQVGAAVVLAPRGSSIVMPGGAPLGIACLSRALFDIECPMCGMSRSFVALGHGHLGAALGFHPAGPLLFVAMLAFIGAVMVAWARQAPPVLARPRFMAAVEIVALTCVAIGIIKMARS